MRQPDSEGGVPLGLVLLEDLALGVVAHVHDVDEAAQIELFGSELGHGDCVVDRWWLSIQMRLKVATCAKRPWYGEERFIASDAVAAVGQTKTTTRRTTCCNTFSQALKYSEQSAIKLKKISRGVQSNISRQISTTTYLAKQFRR